MRAIDALKIESLDQLLADNSYNICGPIDEQIIYYDEFSLERESCKSNIVQKFSLFAKKLIF